MRGKDTVPNVLNLSVNYAHQLGRKEVVEWIEKNMRIYYWVDENAWKAQKKVWGIK